MNIFHWLDTHQHTPAGKLANQLLPVGICAVLFIAFVLLSLFFINILINPWSTEKIVITVYPFDVMIGFFLYFVTAVDYALIIGRMQITNPGSYARVIMNVATVVGCFVGVSFVLFLWGFAKEIPLLIIVLLIFAGSVMIKLAYESIHYFQHATHIPPFIRFGTIRVLKILHAITTIYTFWIPELGSPHVGKMSGLSLAQWSFFLPFIIGLDDLIGYMGAMTIYNVFSLLIGIYIADILIDILLFVSPKLTAKYVQSALISLVAVYAFLYLAYKSFSESILIMHEDLHIAPTTIMIMSFVGIGIGLFFWKAIHNPRAIKHIG